MNYDLCTLHVPYEVQCTCKPVTINAQWDFFSCKMNSAKPRTKNKDKNKIVCLECKTGRSLNRANPRVTIPDDFINTAIDDVNLKAYESFMSTCYHSDFMWLACSAGKLNSRAVQGGLTRTGEPIYIARALSPAWNMCLGCFLPSRGVCYIPWKGTVVMCPEYELLCRREKKRNRNDTNSNRDSVQSGLSLKVLSFKSPLKPYLS